MDGLIQLEDACVYNMSRDLKEDTITNNREKRWR